MVYFLWRTRGIAFWTAARAEAVIGWLVDVQSVLVQTIEPWCQAGPVQVS